MEDNVKEYHSRKQTLKSYGPRAVIVHCCQRSKRKKKKEKNEGRIAGRKEGKRTYTRTKASKERFYLVKWIAAITSRYRISFARSLPSRRGEGRGVHGGNEWNYRAILAWKWKNWIFPRLSSEEPVFVDYANSRNAASPVGTWLPEWGKDIRDNLKKRKYQMTMVKGILSFPHPWRVGEISLSGGNCKLWKYL